MCASSTSRSRPPTRAGHTPPTRTTLEIGAESEVSFATYFNAFPGQLLAALVEAGVGGAAGRDHRQRSRRPVPVQGDRCANHGGRHGDIRQWWSDPPGGGRIRDRTGSVRGRRLDLVRHHHRHRGDGAQCGLVRPAAGTRESRYRPGGDPDLQPAVGLCQRLGGADLGSVGGSGDQRGHRHRPGHQEGGGPSRIRRGRCAAGGTGSRSSTSPTWAGPVATAG